MTTIDTNASIGTKIVTGLVTTAFIWNSLENNNNGLVNDTTRIGNNSHIMEKQLKEIQDINVSDDKGKLLPKILNFCNLYADNTHSNQSQDQNFIKVLEVGMEYLQSFSNPHDLEVLTKGAIRPNKNTEISPTDWPLWIKLYNNLRFISKSANGALSMEFTAPNGHTKTFIVETPDLIEQIRLIKSQYVNLMYCLFNKSKNDSIVDDKFRLEINKKDGIYVFYHNNKPLFEYNELEQTLIFVNAIEELCKHNRLIKVIS